MATRDPDRSGRWLVYTTIKTLTAKDQAPTISAIRGRTGLSQGGVAYWIDILEEERIISCERKQPSGYRRDGSIRILKKLS